MRKMSNHVYLTCSICLASQNWYQVKVLHLFWAFWYCLGWALRSSLQTIESLISKWNIVFYLIWRVYKEWIVPLLNHYLDEFCFHANKFLPWKIFLMSNGNKNEKFYHTLIWFIRAITLLTRQLHGIESFTSTSITTTQSFFIFNHLI